MKTGEGKTLVATLAAYLNALEEKGVYIITVNDYLAKRDSEWMGQIYEFLGLSVGLIQTNMPPEKRIEAYGKDITYGTNNEYGFDYLRDNLATDIHHCCQLRRHYAIVDEVDSILIDEARTPLIISGPVKDSTAKYIKVAKVVARLKKEDHFTVDEKHKNVVLTEDGITLIEKEMGLSNIYSIQNMDVAHMAVQCLKATYLFKRDVDYVVKDGEVIIVDEFTGRLMEGRRYSDGLHQAIEATEKLPIKEESQTLASITFQNYFRMFPKLAGMTGTAVTEAEEFLKIYNLDVLVIPTNKPMVRDDRPDVIYKSKEEKYKAIIAEIKECHKKGQPILVGTIAIETSELLAKMLKRDGIIHSVLNAKYHEKEAEIIAKAGQGGNVTIATNMAGRGTDIVLGEGVVKQGGLHIIGTERHESRRIDNQLRGRSGRQGDPGSSRFYVCLEDDLMRLFGSDRIAKVMDTLGLPPDTPIEHPLITRSIERAQSKVEKYHFGIRKQILEYDDVMNKQRETVYTLRHQILAGQNLPTRVRELISTVFEHYVTVFTQEKLAQPLEDIPDFKTPIEKVFPISGLLDQSRSEKDPDKKVTILSKLCHDVYLKKRVENPEHVFDELTKLVVLRALDIRWQDHLHNMDILREGIGLRAWGQKDPLLEYKIEGFDMFKDLLLSVSEESLELIYRAKIVETDPSQHPAFSNPGPNLEYNNPTPSKTPVPQTVAKEKIGRNDLCYCGSGKKYKKCCMV